MTDKGCEYADVNYLLREYEVEEIIELQLDPCNVLPENLRRTIYVPVLPNCTSSSKVFY